MAVLVTGGNGFIGSNIVRQLLDLGEDVIVFDARPPDAMNLRFLGPRAFEVEQVIGDVRDIQFLLELPSKYPINHVVHCAVFNVPLPTIEQVHSREIVDVNIIGTTNVLELAKVARPRRFVYMSSRTIYGMLDQVPNRPEEGWLGRPQRLYPISKYAGEMIALRYGEIFNFDVRVARVTGPYGPMERKSEFRQNMSALHEWVGAALAGRPITVPDLNLLMDTTHVSDVAAAVVRILTAEAPHYSIYNVGAEDENRIGTILHALEEVVTGTSYSVDRNEDWSDQRHFVVGGYTSLVRLYADLNFRHKFPLKAGLQQYVRWRRDFEYFD